MKVVYDGEGDDRSLLEKPIFCTVAHRCISHAYYGTPLICGHKETVRCQKIPTKVRVPTTRRCNFDAVSWSCNCENFLILFQEVYKWPAYKIATPTSNYSNYSSLFANGAVLRRHFYNIVPLPVSSTSAVCCRKPNMLLVGAQNMQLSGSFLLYLRIMFCESC